MDTSRAYVSVFGLCRGSACDVSQMFSLQWLVVEENALADERLTENFRLKGTIEPSLEY